MTTPHVKTAPGLRRISIDPVTRLEGHGKIDIFLDADGNVADCFFQVPELRGFEKFCEGRPVEELPRITSRICGVCPEAHMMASAKACDAVYGAELPLTARLLRELLYNIFFVTDHTTHFYALGAPDFVMGPTSDPATRNLIGVIGKVGLAIGSQVIQCRAWGHEAAAIFGGKPVNPANAIPGGMSKGLKPEERDRLEEICLFMVEFGKFTLKLLHDVVLSKKEYVDLILKGPYYHETYSMGLVDGQNRVNFYDGLVRVVDPKGKELCKYAPKDYAKPSIGGIMVGLNKVFPTLDCSSCICTPRMAEVAHHPRITLMTYTEVRKVQRNGAGFSVALLKKPRYVVEADCIGCSKCELVCDVFVPHEFDYGLGARRAIYIPHGNAIPQVAVLDAAHCVFDGKCAKACPKDCIDFTQLPEERAVEVGAVILASGLQITPMDAKKEYGAGKLKNVMSPMAMERAQSSNGPYGQVLRPSDGKIPRSIAYVQCAGSRDKSIGVPYCSRVCCMYALKQAVMIKHERHETDITLYHMDIRAFGKGYEQFYRRAMAEGVKVVKAKVAKITDGPDQDLILRVELIDEGGRVAEVRHDLVVLSQGLLPRWHGPDALGIEEAEDGFVKIPDLKTRPTRTTAEGAFVAGVAAGPKDIPDAIVEAGSAAMQAAVYLERTRAMAGARS